MEARRQRYRTVLDRPLRRGLVVNHPKVSRRLQPRAFRLRLVSITRARPGAMITLAGCALSTPSGTRGSAPDRGERRAGHLWARMLVSRSSRAAAEGPLPRAKYYGQAVRITVEDSTVPVEYCEIRQTFGQS